MKYNFDEVIDRTNTRSSKWDRLSDGTLPMWVADMDFAVADPIQKAILKRAQHPIYGYTMPVDGYDEAVIGWYRRRHGWTMDAKWFQYSPGVVAAMHYVAQAFSVPGEKAVLLMPSYYRFFSAIERNGLELVRSPLKAENGRFEIDFDDLEAKLSDPAVRLFFLCNPQNPGGRAWTKEELKRIGDICLENDVLVYADEIHGDLVFEGHSYTPFGSLGESYANNSITSIAPSKTFNLAGMQTSCVVIPNPDHFKTYYDFMESIGMRKSNTFGIESFIAAYSEGDEWLDQLMVYLKGNLDAMREYLQEHLPKVKMMEPEATYLVLLDFSEYGLDPRELHEILLKKGKLWLDEGYMFGEEGAGYERINIACPKSVLLDGLNRMKEALTGL